MAQLFLNITGIILPVIICAGVGYAVALGKLPFDNKTISGLVTNVGYPTLIISHLLDATIKLDVFLNMMIAAAAAMVCFGIIGFAFLKIVRLPIRAFLSPMILNNVGNIGLPVTLLAFGDAGMAYAMAFVVVVVVGISTIGIGIPMGKFSIRDLLRSPIIYAVILTLVLIATGVKLPKPVTESFSILGGMAIPLMLLTLGHTLATLKIETLGRAVYLSLFHVAMAAAVAFGLVELFGFTGIEKGVFVICCLMPVSVATYLFVAEHVPDLAHEVAGFILISTLLTVVVLPLALTYWI